MIRLRVSVLLALGAVALASEAARAADPSFRVTVSPESVSFPETRQVTYRVEVATGSEAERLTLRAETVPAFIGFDGAPEGAGLSGPRSAAFEGPGSMTTGVTSHGDPVCTTALSFRAFHGGLYYSYEYHLDLPANAVSTLVLASDVFDAPWPGEQLRLALTATRTPGPGAPASTLDRDHQLAVPGVGAAGRTGVRMQIATDQPSVRGCSHDPPDNPGNPITVTGRTDPPLAGRSVTLLAESTDRRAVPGQATTPQAIATLPVAGDGTFVLRDWRPQLPGRYAIQARFASNVPELADDFSQPVSFDLTQPVHTTPGWVRVTARWTVLNVSPSGRVLELRYESGGCLRDGRATAVEARDRVTIGVSQEKPVDPRAICTSDPRYPTLRVRLKNPIAGRALPGMSAITFIPRERNGRWVVPRVIGLRAIEARRVLRAQRFAVRGDRGGTIARQRPTAGTLVRTVGGTVVTLATKKNRPASKGR